MDKVRHKNSGFTFIELAIVLVIIGVLLASVVGTLGKRIDNTARANTEKDLKLIKQALIGYTIVNGYLPCPDNPADTNSDGISDGDGDGEDGTDNPCSVVGGAGGSLPWVTLGVGASDAWGNRYSYWVDENFVDSNFSLSTSTILFGAVGTHNTTGTSLANKVVAVVFSRGKNGYGAVGEDFHFKQPVPSTGHVDEEFNDDLDRGFISRLPTEAVSADVGEFDDIVIWISEYELKAKMVEAGALP